MFEDVDESKITEDCVEQGFKVSSFLVLTLFMDVVELDDFVFFV